MRPTQFTLTLITLAALASPAAAQSVSHEKFTLSNGITVILHEDHSLPVACVNIWYRVGSKDEPKGRTGFAHLFEHLMFMGTDRAPGSAFDDIMEAGGGWNNATTSSDRTNYFEFGPARLLPTLLWLEADRLEDLGRMMTQEKLDKQRDVVRNERRQSYENQPYGKADLVISELMYPEGHPYHIPVIGTHADLEAATVDDVKQFFANFYVPANLSLCVAGDFDPKTIKPLIDRLFGTLPPGQTPQRRTADPVCLDRVIRRTMTDQVQLPKLTFVYHSPAFYAEGDAEMDLVAAILTTGKTSRLHKRLVFDDKLAVRVSAGQQSSQLGSLFEISVLAKPGADLDRIESIVDQEIARLVRDGPTADELARHQVRIETDTVAGLQELLTKADRLNAYEYYWGQPDSFKRDLDRYRNATTAGVRKWAGKVLTPNARLIMRILPEERMVPDSPRDATPALLAARPFEPQSPTTLKLANGVNVLLWNKPELPLVAMSLHIRSGGALDSPTTAGLAELTADLLDEGAGDRDALEFADAVQGLGASFRAAAGRESFELGLTVLKRNLQPAIGLLADAALRPRMNEKDWDRVKRLHLENLREQDDDPNAVGARVSARMLYGDNHPYGAPQSGTPDTVAAIDLGDLIDKHAACFRPQYATILISGDITSSEAESLLNQAFGTWKADGPARAAPVAGGVPARDEMKIYVVDRPDSVQTVVGLLMPGVPYRNPHRAELTLINTVLGGSFTSRLNALLREEKGWTYGARSSFVMAPTTGYFVARSAIQAPHTGEAAKAIIDQIDKIANGDITEAELTKARESRRAGVIESFAGLSGVISTAATLIENDLPFSTVADDLRRIADADLDAVNTAARGAFQRDRAILVLVGDKTLIFEQLRQYNLATPTELDPYGNPMK